MLYDDIKSLVKKFVLGLVELELDRRFEKEFGTTAPAKPRRVRSRFDAVLDKVRSRAAKKAAATRRERRETKMQDEKMETQETPTTEATTLKGGVEVKLGANGKTEVWKDGEFLFARARSRDAIREAKRRGIWTRTT